MIFLSVYLNVAKKGVKGTKMKITAVICEYNPFHKGHQIQLNSIKECGESIVCIMSGGFVQRGEPAVFDKYKRAHAAILYGADLVLELPFPYCCSAAEFFALGGVSIANSLGCVDNLCFGSECGSVDTLNIVSERVLSDSFTKQLSSCRKDKSNREIPFAKLRENVYKSLYKENFPISPNDILGVEYLNTLKKLGSNITPVTYKRENNFSATESRKQLHNFKNFDIIPQKAREIFESAEMYELKNIEKAILSYYRLADIKNLEKYEGMTNGLASNLVNAARESQNIEEFFERLTGKGHTNAKIRRAIICGMTKVETDMLKTPPAFSLVLASNDIGREIIKTVAKVGSIPLLTKPAHFKKLSPEAKKQAEFAYNSDNLLTLMCTSSKESAFFLKKTPIIIQDK